MEVDITWLVLSLHLATSPSLSSQSFSSQPSDVTVSLGSDLTLPCVVVGRRGEVQWTRDSGPGQFGLGIERGLPEFPRYSMRGGGGEGDFSLKITEVSLEDDAKFQCQVARVPGYPGIQSTTAQVTVQVKPEPPVIINALSLNGGPMEVMDGSNIEVKCKSARGKPPASLRWLDGAGAEIAVTENKEGEKNIEEETEDIPDSKIKNQVSTIKLEVKKGMSPAVVCEASHPGYEEPLAARLGLSVQFTPELAISQEPGEIKEGDDVVITCTADSNPTRVMFKWYMEDVIEVDRVVDTNVTDQVSALELKAIDKSLNGKKVKCWASNRINHKPHEAEKVHTLNIHYAPTFTKKPKAVSTDPGKKVSLECEADGNPAPTYAWFRNGDENNVLDTSKKHEFVLGPDTVGAYSCRATVRGYKEIRTEARVLMFGPPKILDNSDTSVDTRLGAEAVMTCDSFALPLPNNDIVWKFNDIDLVADPKYEINKAAKTDGVVSSLKIKNVVMDSFGDYSCSVTNDYGEDTKTVKLNRIVESRVVLMVLVSLAVAALVVLAVLLTVLQCAKIRRGRAGARRSKRSEGTGDSGEDSDYSSYDGEEEEETRMGDTGMSDTSSVQSPRPPPRTRRPPQSVGSVSPARTMFPLPGLGGERLTPLPPAPTLTTFRRPGPELVLRPPPDLASPHHLGSQAPVRNVTAHTRYEFPSFLRDLEARRREMTPQPQSQIRGQGLPPPSHFRGQAPPPPTHYVSDVSLTGARGKLASLV